MLLACRLFSKSLLMLLCVSTLGCASRAPMDVGYQDLSADQHMSHSYCYQYLYGHYGQAANYPQAFTWCSKGARSGVASSQTLLGEMYFSGLGVKKDLAIALSWYKLAAKQGHPHAQYLLSKMFDEGLGTTAMHELASEFRQKAATSGRPQALQDMQARERVREEMNGPQKIK